MNGGAPSGPPFCYALGDHPPPRPTHEIMQITDRHAGAIKTAVFGDGAYRPIAGASRFVLVLFILAFATAPPWPALAGPPYITDDP
ncbi:MAG TPA: hypothetical protein VI407_09745, partial [Erythrobacter sp.]